MIYCASLKKDPDRLGFCLFKAAKWEQTAHLVMFLINGEIHEIPMSHPPVAGFSKAELWNQQYADGPCRYGKSTD